MLFWKVKITAWNYKYYICPYESTCELHYVHKSRVEICRVYVNIGLFTLPLIKIMNYVVVLYKQCARIDYQREVRWLWTRFVKCKELLSLCIGKMINMEMEFVFLLIYIYCPSKTIKRLFKMRLANKCTCMHVYL